MMEGSQGERIFFHYPRLQAMTGAEESIRRSTKESEWTVARIAQGAILALPVTDPLDGERVVCYRSFLPAANALV